MSSVSNISANLIQSYINYNSKSELSTKEMFQMLSLELGGDSETITKDQLDTYMEDANDGLVDVSNSELKALTELQDNWDNISGGKDSITYDNMANYSDILVGTVTNDTSSSDNLNLSHSPMDEVYAYLTESAGLSDNSAISSSDLSACLESLLTGTTDKNDDANSNLIATLTNLIAAYSSTSTVDVEA